MSVPQTDTILKPIVDQLILVAQQIDGIGTCYDKIPEGALEDNAVMFPVTHMDVKSGTNRRLTLHITFDIVHHFRRTRLQETLARCYAAVPAWVNVLGSYGNATLGGTVQMIDLQAIDIREVKHAGQSGVGVISTLVVRTEIPIPGR